MGDWQKMPKNVVQKPQICENVFWQICKKYVICDSHFFPNPNYHKSYHSLGQAGISFKHHQQFC